MNKKEGTENLLRTEILLKASLNSPNDIIILSLDKNYNYLFFNESHRNSMKLAYQTDVEVGKRIFEFMTNEEDIKKAKHNYSKALNGEAHVTRESYGDFDVKTYETYYNPIIDNNEIIGVSAFAIDISEVVNARRQIEKERNTAQHYLDIVEVMILLLDSDGNIKLINKKGCSLLGLSEDEIIGKNWVENFIQSSEAKESKQTLNRIFSGQLDFINNYENTIINAKGEQRYISWNIRVLHDEAHNIIGVLKSGQDITDKRQFEDELIKSETNLKLAQSIAKIGSWELEISKNQIWASDEAFKIYELDRTSEYLEYDIIRDMVSAEDRVMLTQALSDLITNQKTYDVSFKITSGKGNLKYINSKANLVFSEDNKPFKVVGIIHDITDMKLKEEELISSNERFEKLFEKAPLGYQSLDINGHLREVNHTWCNILGYEKEEVIGTWFGDYLTPSYREQFLKKFELFKQLGKIHSEFEMIHKSGKTLFIAFDGLIGHNDKQEFEQTYCNLNDITKTVEAQKLLVESEKKLSTILASVEEAVYGVDSNEKCTFVNQSFLELLGYDEDEVIGKDMHKLIHHSYFDGTIYPDTLCPIKDILKSGKKIRIDLEYLWKKNGEKLPVEYSGNPLYDGDKLIGAVVTFKDITERLTRLDELKYASNHDFLTGLYNRRYFVESYKKMDNPKYYPLGLIMLDVNGLKIINDAFGTGAGDRVLQMVSDILQYQSREEDITCRISGGEFAIILPNISQDELELIITNIQAASKKEKVNNIELSVATGYEIKDVDIEGNLDDILKLAENHLYRHKLVENDSVRNNSIKAILQTLTEKYKEEKIHSAKVSQYCKQMGEKLKFNGEDLKELELAGMYHDIGKISIPDAILKKPGRLTEEEYKTIKSHPEISYQILRAADEYSDLANHALHHHERWDGLGYPSGLKGKNIPLFSRIICIVDAYEAMTASRPYRKAMSEDYALKEIIKYSGSQFDEKLARIFVEKVLLKKWESAM